MENVRHESPVSFDPLAFYGQLRSRWRIVAISCAVAAGASLAASMLMESRYTATCRVLVEPPAGSDPRVSTAVSPIYLESLRTYEMFASSDDLFLQASKKFGLRRDSTPIEKLKKRVLKVEVIRNTKILEINATLPDPARAHALALYIGEQAVALSREVSRAGDQELLADAEKQASDSRQALAAAQKLWSDAVNKGPTEQLAAELDADVELRSHLQRDLASAEADLAESQAAPADQTRPGEVAQARARADKLRAQVAAVERSIAQEQSLIAERSTRLTSLDSQRKAAEATLKNAETRLADVRGATGYRGERLNLIDPGIVPERPSAPNVALNVLAAIFAALVLSILYVLLEISYRKSEQASEHTSRHASAHAYD
jgi:capsular polysaccharide biosynthesis protein